jgi:DnaJ family protein C protein 19
VDQYQQRKAAMDAEAAAQAGGAEGQGEAGKEQPQQGWFSNMFNLSFKVGRRFYDGGFEDEMTKREAALILGIRESAPRDKVREAHRRLARANHPDMGGSPFIATKINEAKEKLMGA